MLHKLEKVIGHRIDPKLRGSIDTLNEFPMQIIDQIRLTKHPALAEQLAQFYVAERSRKFVKLFVENVIYGNESASTWLKGRILIPDFSLVDLLTRNSNEILLHVGNEFTHVIKPLRSSWDGGSSSPGAPARIETDATYLSTTVPQTVSLSLTDVIAIYNPTISYRRWLAQRIARYLYSKNALFAPDVKLNDDHLPDKNLWAQDAIAAYAGLTKELLQLKYKYDDVPGFCGPDDWYF